MNKPDLPEWTRDLPNHTLIGAREVGQVLGLDRSTVLKKFKAKQIPPPYKNITKTLLPNHAWRLGDIREFLAESKAKGSAP